jgi:hypothetical protein
MILFFSIYSASLYVVLEVNTRVIGVWFHSSPNVPTGIFQCQKTKLTEVGGFIMWESLSGLPTCEFHPLRTIYSTMAASPLCTYSSIKNMAQSREKNAFLVLILISW